MCSPALGDTAEAAELFGLGPIVSATRAASRGSGVSG